MKAITTHISPTQKTRAKSAMFLYRCFCLTGFILISLCTQLFADEADPQSAAATVVVERLHNTLIHVMQHSDTLKFEGRYAELEPVIISKFDTPLISRVILSRYWESLDEQQRLEFIELYNRLIVATYASRFDGYDGHDFRLVTTEQLNRGRLLVRTELAAPGDKPVKLDYLMNQRGDNWMIISVIADGANDLSIRRGEYADVIKLRGYDALLEEIRVQIRDMENEI